VALPGESQICDALPAVHGHGGRDLVSGVKAVDVAPADSNLIQRLPEAAREVVDRAVRRNWIRLAEPGRIEGDQSEALA
jgi:hypothetical protein